MTAFMLILRIALSIVAVLIVAPIQWLIEKVKARPVSGRK